MARGALEQEGSEVWPMALTPDTEESLRSPGQQHTTSLMSQSSALELSLRPRSQRGADLLPARAARQCRQRGRWDGGGSPGSGKAKETIFCSSSNFFSQKEPRGERGRITLAFSLPVATTLTSPAARSWVTRGQLDGHIMFCALVPPKILVTKF